jgi:hypothetical protein
LLRSASVPAPLQSLQNDPTLFLGAIAPGKSVFTYKSLVKITKDGGKWPLLSLGFSAIAEKLSAYCNSGDYLL